MRSPEEILANLERMAAQQAALAEERARRAAEKLDQMRKIQERSNHLARYMNGGVDINPLPHEVAAPAGMTMQFRPYRDQK